MSASVSEPTLPAALEGTVEIARACIAVQGAVQGVGFRPFVYRLARELALDGWVQNSSQGVLVEVEGARVALRQFVLRLEQEKPPRAIVQNMACTYREAVGYGKFEIRPSAGSGAKTALILPDLATCADCAREIFDPANRRYRYPFTNCTNCGPRFSIIEALPYDRPNTSMRRFAMCPECEREYHDPLDRRFHAQPNACPRCGPHLELWSGDGRLEAACQEALWQAAETIRAGKILALKGLGGFQLLANAGDADAVGRLRERKRRPDKPFALMFPSIKMAREHCEIPDLEVRLLLSPEAPIVLLERSASTHLEFPMAGNVAPRNKSLGIMLPYTPLHHLLMRELGFPVVATSGNLGDEPICTDEREALERLKNIADSLLVHDRPIVRPMDDSIVRVMCGQEMVLRRARGYAPLPIHVKKPLPAVLALGAHLKNSVALSLGKEVFISQHIGDLETAQAHAAFCKAAADLPRLYDTVPEIVACDLHPDYLSTRHAAHLSAESAPPARLRAVQHHFAHVLACMAENEIEPPALGVAWDGTGYGTDGTIWGGEFLAPTRDFASFERIAHFRPFRLPGGEAAIKQPRRTALGVLFEIFGRELWRRPQLTAQFSAAELGPLRQMLVKGINTPATSSVGRLFDAVASLIGARQCVSFEGQAAMELEACIEPGVEDSYPFEIGSVSPRIIDWEPAFVQVIRDAGDGASPGAVSAKFHNMLTEIVVAAARIHGEQKVVLSGGCFQNKYLLERTVRRLLETGFRPCWHRRVPPNDGGIALGQIMAAKSIGNQ